MQDFEKSVFTLETWKEQIGSGNGDKTKTAHDFVHRDAPFGVRVIVQHGKFQLSIC